MRDVELAGCWAVERGWEESAWFPMLGVAFAAECYVFPWDIEGFVDEEAFQQGGGQRHLCVGYMVFTKYQGSLFLADQGQCLFGLGPWLVCSLVFRVVLSLGDSCGTTLVALGSREQAYIQTPQSCLPAIMTVYPTAST